ncbi:MAG TPA: GAF domain-containing protein [Stellaceae bacterium]|nr:GAF domain-containing protein [Stellaceae bacterium]
MQVRFWGTRGSIAKPGPSTIRYGGNTSCVEVRSAGGTLVVLDCGTGALALGADLMRRGTPVRGHLLISHTHWDHIQGLPFFAPLFVPGNEWDVFAPHGFLQSVREMLAGQMQHTYFPVDLAQLGATIRYHDLTEGAFRAGDIEITSRYLNHPALTLGYRLEADDVAIAYCCDHEPHSRTLAYGSSEIGDQDHEHVAFVSGVDLLIHDAQYRAAEYEAKLGWGHSTLESVATIARLAGVRAVAFTHHDPSRDDDTIDREVAALATDGSLKIFAAAEGQVVDIVPGPDHTSHHQTGAPAAEIAAPPRLAEQTVLLGVADSELYNEFWRALHADGIRVRHAISKAAAIEAARLESPSLIILERYLPGDGLAACRELRGLHDPALAGVPIIITAAQEEIGPGAAAGVTDWLLKPFSEIYARTRMRAWLMRMTCHWAQPPIPADEAQRLTALRNLSILDTPPEDRFDRLTRIASATFEVPIAMVTLVDESRQWFKSACGLEVRETERDISFCAHAILERDVMVVPDALLDERFADHPAVINDPRIRFYAGCPLVLDDGAAIGTLCLVDTRPRDLGPEKIRLLEDLAALVLQELQRPPGAEDGGAP